METEPNVERFNFDTNSWSYGPHDIPQGLSYGSSLAYKGSFLVLGGQDNVNYDASPDIYLYNPATEDFDLMEQKMQTARHSPTAILVGPEVVECSI